MISFNSRAEQELDIKGRKSDTGPHSGSLR